MRIVPICLGLLLAACVAAGPKPPEPSAANPILGGAIATTSLDAPAPEAPKPMPANPVPAQPDSAKSEPVPVAAPAAPQSPAEAKCLKAGNSWVSLGKTGAQTCAKRTRDAGKSCSKQTQCEGLCLARSGSCAPIVPLFGCNEIFQADGRRTTLCID